MSLFICTGLDSSSWEQLSQQLPIAGLLSINDNSVLKSLIEALTTSSKDAAKIIQEATSWCINDDYLICLPLELMNQEFVANMMATNELDIRWFLFYDRPAESLTVNPDELTITVEAQQCIVQWQEQVRKLYEISHMVSHNSKLLNCAECASNLPAFNHYISSFIDRPLAEKAESHVSFSKTLPEKLICYHAEKILADLELIDEVEEIYDDIKLQTNFITSLDDFNKLEQTIQTSAFLDIHKNVTDVVNQVKSTNQALHKSRIELKSSRSQQTEAEQALASLQQKLEQKQQNLSETESAKDKVELKNKQYKNDIEALKSEFQSANTNLNAKDKQIDQLSDELNLSLLQVSQSQEEIELKNKQNKNDIETLMVELQSVNTNLNAKDKQIDQLSDELNILLLQVSQLQEEVESVHTQKVTADSQNTALENEFELLQGQKEELLSQSNSEIELLEHQVNQLQEELESVSSQKVTLDSQHSALKIEFELLQGQKEELLSQSNSEIELLGLLGLQVNQLQEELEISQLTNADYNDQLQELKEQLSGTKSDLIYEQENKIKVKAEYVDSAAKYEQTLAELTALQGQVQRNKSRNETLHAELNVKQQQCEQNLENTKAENQELSKNIVALNSQLQSEIQSQLNVASEKELTLLQVNQLQEELELKFSENQIINEKMASLDSLLQDELRFKEDVAAENKIALLQINQLQEELEFYYVKFIEQEKSMNNITTNIIARNEAVFNHCSVNSIEFLGQYDTDGYHELKLQLNNLTLADGRLFEKLRCKLVDKAGCLGVEFRPFDESSDYLQWLDKYTDEYGAYIVYLPQPSESLKEEQDYLFERLNTSDRILISSVAKNLAHYFATDDVIINHSEIPEPTLRQWRVNAYQLATQLHHVQDWMSFDLVNLKEEMRTEGYEHLWLTFDNLLVGERYFQKFDLKATVSDITEEAVFANKFTFEFRELQNGLAPLQAWPPETSDDFGYKLNLVISTDNNALEILGIEQLSKADQTLVGHFINNFSSFIKKLHEQQVIFDRPWQQWEGIGNHLYSLKHAPELSGKAVEKIQFDTVKQDSEGVELSIADNKPHIENS